jgi:prevent-host-death family protein
MLKVKGARGRVAAVTAVPVLGLYWRHTLHIAILIAMKRVSVAEAKNTLPALLHEADAAPVELVRRGRPVAVILSRASYDKLQGKSEGVWAALERFREMHDLEEVDVAGALESTRDRSTEGRPGSSWSL